MMITDSLEFFGDKFARFQMHRDFVALVVPLDAEGRAFIKKLENPNMIAFPQNGWPMKHGERLRKAL